MGWTSLVLFGTLVLLAGAWVLYLYRRREVGVPGLGPLAALRIAALAVVALLLLDPHLPAGASLRGARAWTLVDGSRSMVAPAGPSSPWNEALRAAAPEGGGPVLVFGGDPRPLEELTSTDRPPFAASRLVPALERAAESGAGTVRVVTDLRLEDAARARAVAERLGLAVTVEALGGEVRSAGVASFGIAGPLEENEPVAAEATLFAVGAGPSDSLTLEIREEDRIVLSRGLAVPDEGRLARVELDLPPPQSGGEVRYTARVSLGSDDFPDDDERVAWADVDPEEGNLVLVSLEPDWEPRFLLPVLQRVTGLPARGFLQVGADRFLAMDPAGAAGTVDRATVERLARGAELLVLQAASTLPPWTQGALGTVRRSVVLALGPAAAASAGVEVGAARTGEWYVSPEVPPSPLAGELAGAEIAGLPPLGTLLPVARAGQPPGPAPLAVQLRGSGASEPALVLVTPEGAGRRVVALASGFWRWGFRPGAGRDTYERLWSGVAGWLLADEPLAGGPGIRPEERTVAAEEPLWWAAPGLAGTEVGLRLARGDTVVLDTSLVVPQAGRFRVRSPGVGTWSWRAEVGGSGGGAGGDRGAGGEAGSGGQVVGAGGDPSDAQAGRSWEGRLDVEAWTGDLRHPRDTLLSGAGPAAVTGARGPGRPLRTHPLPYLLVLVLLSAEWVLRRRKGLR